MKLATGNQNVKELVDKLNFTEKVERSLDLLEQGYKEFGDA